MVGVSLGTGRTVAGGGAVRPWRRLAAAALAPLIAVALVSCDKPAEVQPEPPRLVTATKVGEPGAVIEADFPGRAVAVRELELSFRVTGQMTEQMVKVGESVKAGQTVAQLDMRDFQIAVDVADGRLAKAEADIEVAQADYNRGLAIQKENAGAISQAVIDQRLGALKQAKATVVSVQASLEDAKNALIDTTLKAPFDAVIVERRVESFEHVVAKQPVLRLVDAAKIKLTFQLPEQHISRLPDVATYTCYFDAVPGVDIPATVYEVGTEALQSTRTYPVTLIMDQPSGAAILPGMSGKVHIRLKAGALATASGIVVPVGAVFADESDQRYVWVVDPVAKRVTRKPVQVGRVLAQGVMVEGLTPGTWIVTAGVHVLHDNQEVRLPEAQAQAQPAGGAS